MPNCNHPKVELINPYEMIRKYRCKDCGIVAMCSCEENFAQRFFSHQLDVSIELETQRQIQVNGGFQENLCDECRGIPSKAYPKAETYGNTTKYKRYYWREIQFETIEKFGNWCDEEGKEDDWLVARFKYPDVYDSIENKVLSEILERHKQSPKYKYIDKSAQEVLDEAKVEVENVNVTYIRSPEKQASVLYKKNVVTVEEYAKRYYEDKGHQVLFCESVPFHVLFGVFMWLVIQDPEDLMNQTVMFGNRDTQNESNEVVVTMLPEDFGTKGYYLRREDLITEHLKFIAQTGDLLWLFDYWVDPSSNFRQYLWAHRDNDVFQARRILEIMNREFIIKCLKYLIEDYWAHYLGWPDLLVTKKSDFVFVEVKSSGDGLSGEQKSWIQKNASTLKFNFRLLKLHKAETISM